MEKGKAFKLFVPPRLSGGQVSAVKPQTSGFNKCPGDDFNLPFVMTTAASHGEITDAGKNMETINELYSKLYKEAEKIKRWKLAVESELKQKERKFQENRKIIEAQRKAIQELQFENEKLSLKLEDEICENKDLLKENSASRHLCNLLKETCSHFTEKMIVAFEELRVQAENTRLEMCFKCESCAYCVSISVLTVRCNEKDDVIRDIKTHLQESKNKITDLEEAKSKNYFCYIKIHLVIGVWKTETMMISSCLETELQSTVKALIQVTQEKETQMEECKEAKALHASMIEEFETSTYNLKSLLQEEQNSCIEKVIFLNIHLLIFVNLAFRNELESLREKMAKKGEEVKSKLDESEENVICNIVTYLKSTEWLYLNKMEKDQMGILIFEQITILLYSLKVNKLQLEMENMNKQHKARVDIYEKEIEAKGVTENNLLEEVEKMRLLADEATIAQRETDIRCQHKITEMVALMEKHKHEYDKMVEEKDTELKLYKIKEQEQSSLKRALVRSTHQCWIMKWKGCFPKMSNLLACLSHTEKRGVVLGQCNATYTVKTPPVHKMQSESSGLISEQRKKQKVLLQLDAQSDSSEHSDLLVKLRTNCMKPTTSNLKAPSSALKLATMRKVRETGWTAVSKMDRKRKIKDAEKLFS
uniref:Synaptonemal complex protein 1 n=1 Tax=Phasianus colchicus TaxID=9054 RepID=A0A669QFS2_PHACC